MTRIKKIIAGLLVFAMLAFGLACATSEADAATGSVSLTAGSLTLGLVSDFTYPTTQLTGNDIPTLASSFAALVTDATGSGSGWNVTAQIGVMTATGGKTIAASGHTITGVTRTFGIGTTPTNSITYPIQIPTSASKIYSAGAASGIGISTLSFATNLFVPASTLTGSYSATLTLSLVTGP